MKCQSLFSKEKKKNIINLLSAESAHRTVSTKCFSLWIAFLKLNTYSLFYCPIVYIKYSEELV